MSKKHLATKIIRETDSLLVAAQNSYGLGDYQAARRLAHRLLTSSEASSENKQEALAIINKTHVDPLALLVGFGSLAFSLLIAFVCSY